MDKNSVAMLEIFLRRHGKSGYAAYAKARLSELKRTQTALVKPPAKPPVESTLKPTVGIYPAESGEHKVEESFRDCANCPEMMVIPAGSFMMGSNDGAENEKPVHRVIIAKPFAVGRFEVTQNEWIACVSDSGCDKKVYGFNARAKGRDPIGNISWNDANAYVKWLTKKTGKSYRLLTEAEWEYVARAGSPDKYSWGNEIGRNKANCQACGSKWDRMRPAPVGSFAPNAFKVYDMHGNMAEWVEDCWERYEDAPDDGSAQTAQTACQYGNRILRGGSWNDYPDHPPGTLRSAYRTSANAEGGNDYIGFRVARTLAP